MNYLDAHALSLDIPPSKSTSIINFNAVLCTFYFLYETNIIEYSSKTKTFYLQNTFYLPCNDINHQPSKITMIISEFAKIFETK